MSMLVGPRMPERPPSNVRLGTTVVNQEEADRDIPRLLAVPAKWRFISMESLLGHVSLRLLMRACRFPSTSISTEMHTASRGDCIE
jgi:protein gp37